jgi:16S rRNA (cytosine967-C5)-methyltransferase
VRLSYPDFLVEGARRGFGEGWEEELGALNLPAEIAVRVNTRRTTAEGLAERLRGEGLHPREVEGVPGALVLPSGEPPYRTLAFAEGEFWPQDVGSQRVARLAVPGASERLLDLCAGSGTKSFLAASDAGTGARVMAVDVSEAKVAALAARKERLGFPEVEALACDARALPFPDGAFDVVLLDAPCTGAGTVRRHPELKWRRQEGDVGAAAARQGELLAAAARLVRPGGRLVYAVCSFLPEEGKEVVGRFLAARPEFAGAPSDFACLPAGGREAWQGFVVTAGRSGRLMRPREEGGDAFYAAVLVRRDATDGNH